MIKIGKESILELRKKIKDKKERKKIWLENKRNFEKNILKIFSKIKNKNLNKKWKIYILVGSFLEKKALPYSYDSFSSTNLLAASKKQGFEVMVFLNRARIEFLSLPALIPLILHELEHVKQAQKNPKEYLLSMLNDKLSEKLEKEAEKESKKVSDEFKKEYTLESVLYCYDLGGWKKAKKMADFLFNQEKLYGGGYEKGISVREYKAFLNAKKEKNINLFIEIFVE